MSINRMLITKEFSVLKRPILLYAVLSLVAVAIIAIPFKTAALLGSILQCTVMIVFYCHITTRSIIRDSKDKCHILWFGFPVSIRRVQLTKLLSLWLIFFTILLPTLALTLIVIAGNSNWPAVASAFYVFGFALYISAFTAVMTTAFITRSEGVTIFAMVCSNLAVTALLNLIPKSPTIKQAFDAGTIADSGFIWPSLLVNIATGSIVFAALLTCITLLFLRQQREVRY